MNVCIVHYLGIVTLVYSDSKDTQFTFRILDIYAVIFICSKYLS